MLAALEDLEKANDVRVLDLLQQIYLLEDLPLRKVILHIRLLDRLDSNVFASEFVDPESDLSEGALADQLDELVVLESSRWQFIILLDVGLYELYQSVSLLKYCFVNFGRPISATLARSHIDTVRAPLQRG